MAAIDRYGASQTAVSGSLFTITTTGTATTNLDGWGRETDYWYAYRTQISGVREESREVEEFKKLCKKIWYTAHVPTFRDAAPPRVRCASARPPRQRRPHGQGQGCR
jgi:hypothetical protein